MNGGSDLIENGPGLYPRLDDYKKKFTKSNQESRRLLLLTEQKKRREDSFNAFRDFNDIFAFDDEASHEEEFLEIGEIVDKPKFPKLKDLFMFSEWMTDLPLDFRENWMFLLCPVGKRCLVRSCKGITTVYGKLGYPMARFKSSLPNGGIHDKTITDYSKSDVTVLDCIWNGDVKKYFILDILYWKDQSYLDTDVSFRSFWIKSKIGEIPNICERTKTNPYPFIPLNYYPCDIMTISSVMSQYPYFELNKPAVDGILFYHKEGFYTPGQTPLVLWIKPYMLMEIFGIDVHVSEGYFQARPSTYTNMYDFISRFDELHKQKKKKKKKWKQRRSSSQIEGMDIGETDGNI